MTVNGNHSVTFIDAHPWKLIIDIGPLNEQRAGNPEIILTYAEVRVRYELLYITQWVPEPSAPPLLLYSTLHLR
ncbi:unnamed protein product [Nezara viridula]|uniref:Uncharacterized protein n=1 Tax=Nezara viridula TaxID=85310 RepID=A0A9P0E3M1_NEZVI|nr:unnamed protein product [Nezara viridula]